MAFSKFKCLEPKLLESSTPVPSTICVEKSFGSIFGLEFWFTFKFEFKLNAESAIILSTSISFFVGFGFPVSSLSLLLPPTRFGIFPPLCNGSLNIFVTFEANAPVVNAPIPPTVPPPAFPNPNIFFNIFSPSFINIKATNAYTRLFAAKVNDEDINITYNI